ncbi:MAG: hypothetical protein V7K14_02355 [Nostoc sp.]|uniref:hypothetical protein n=1 Tax=unclassified Nostoc TaxID=2593658 RepID=UPI0025E79D2B|nr:hypothetical protein [Nostoc sp. NMS7]MBN3950451.1 hypothetical protein [Nostoc sp. NMS7]
MRALDTCTERTRTASRREVVGAASRREVLGTCTERTRTASRREAVGAASRREVLVIVGYVLLVPSPQ